MKSLPRAKSEANALSATKFCRAVTGNRSGAAELVNLIARQIRKECRKKDAIMKHRTDRSHFKPIGELQSASYRAEKDRIIEWDGKKITKAGAYSAAD